MDDQLKARLGEFSDLLIQWNGAMNLVSRRDIHRLQERHIDDSLRLVPLLEREGALLDIGSGGGLPGIVLAIAQPQRTVVLLDRAEKKCRFLAQAATELQLDNVEVVCGAAESLDRPGVFTYVVSRAVAPAESVWKWAEPLLQKQGKMLHMTGEQQITQRSRA